MHSHHHHQQQYDDSTLTLTSIGTPDPFVTRAGGLFYFTFTTGNRIEIWSSRSLADIESAATRHVIWTPSPFTDTEASADLWAPELHAVRGRWYIYYAAAHPERGNASHRMYVLGGPPADEDPCQGQWEFLGRISGTPDGQWAIDGTVFEIDGNLYMAYSGWPLEDSGRESDLVQQLFIVRLKDPTRADSAPVLISRSDRDWEISRDDKGEHGINEGPQFLCSPSGLGDGGNGSRNGHGHGNGIADGILDVYHNGKGGIRILDGNGSANVSGTTTASWRGLVYSCAGSWTHEYKMASLQFLGGDPLAPASWRKSAAPLIETAEGGRGPFGPGHGSFLDLGDGQVVAVYHATDRPTDGWENRRARVQRVAFTPEGPYMGKAFGMEAKDNGKGNGKAGRLLGRLKAKVKGAGGREDNPLGEESLRALLEGRTVANGNHGPDSAFCSAQHDFACIVYITTMRLLHAKTEKLHEFFDDQIPEYAILSHTWLDDEVKFQDMNPGKIRGCCQEAIRDGLEWVWVDTCCIDSTSSTELQEAINSMYDWYGNSEVCYAYLADVPAGQDAHRPDSKFRKSRWFTRGWTLQELLAPTSLQLLDQDWNLVGYRDDLAQVVESSTGHL
ncbi:Uu.00g029370.m01.CDS01 [Anthostomella pinea]|uniref:Uu.00g029370.m01.CDS01 n=1 Tax=Anthostomella pinea TaxID=933095 RepID=A0AAI8YAH0_9PEZI|nr:Uu.00g029370.m01.CDS01 [Anthostomella pinea]